MAKNRYGSRRRARLRRRRIAEDSGRGLGIESIFSESYQSLDKRLLSSRYGGESDYSIGDNPNLFEAMNVARPEIAVGAFEDGGGDGIDFKGLTEKVQGYAKIAAPWMAAGLSIYSGISKAKAVKEQGRQKARNLRRQGDAAVERAEREKKVVMQDQEFQRAEMHSSVVNTGLGSGQETFAEGTAVNNIMDYVKNEAIAMAEDIMTQGRRQKDEFYKAADASEKAAKEASKGALIKGAAGAVTGFAGL